MLETIERPKHAVTVKSENFYNEYEKFSAKYQELMASGLTKPRESQLRSADALLNDMTRHGTLNRPNNKSD